MVKKRKGLVVEVSREVVVEKPVEPGVRLYAFATVVRCPRCGSLQTRVIEGARASRPEVRWRVCTMPVCRCRFKEVGRLV